MANGNTRWARSRGFSGMKRMLSGGSTDYKQAAGKKVNSSRERRARNKKPYKPHTRILDVAALIICLLLAGCHSSKARIIEAELVRVIDADTIEVMAYLGMDTYKKVSIRVNGVDAPERNTPEGKAATEYAKSILPKKIILNDRGKEVWTFRRYVAEVWFFKEGTSDYLSLAKLLIENGHVKNKLAPHIITDDPQG